MGGFIFILVLGLGAAAFWLLTKISPASRDKKLEVAIRRDPRLKPFDRHGLYSPFTPVMGIVELILWSLVAVALMGGLGWAEFAYIRLLLLYRGINLWPGLLLGVAIFVVGVMAWGLVPEYKRAWRLNREGVDTTTLIVDLFEKRAEPRTPKTYNVAYDLKGQGTISHEISWWLYQRLKVGEPIGLRYIPCDPQIFRPRW